ncbi:hypothetical protein [Psychrobacter aestuarii]|uniref:Uncharacterized protein n=1 Tax=Psychrobacter aestuarii TaxID=556327 RepID=A0ABN0VXR5_9GAMM|nr:hypothetical protein [Psychrobacter aestuarii]
MKYMAISVSVVLIALCTVIYFMFHPKSVAHYCVDDTCIDIVVQNKIGVGGGSNYVTVYRDRKFTRLFLYFGDYAQFQMETLALISRYTVDGKIAISGSLPVKIQGNLNDILIFEDSTFYREASNNEVDAFDFVREHGRAI